MNNKPIILVTGATGAQGGSVARALLASDKFAVHILTRNPSSKNALALSAAGAILIKGDLEDKKSIIAAMHNCYGVFGVTSFWEHYHNEYQHGINLLDAAKTAGIRHLVLHTLPNYSQLSGGKYEVPHCDLKAALKVYSRQMKLPATFVQLAFYYENFFNFFPPQPQEDGSFSFGFPQGDTKLAMVSVEDLGPVVATIFNHPDAYLGRTVGVVGADDSCAQYAAEMTEISGKKINYQFIPRDVYAGLGFAGAEELANMFEVQRLHIPDRQLDLIESYGLHPGMQNFRTWLTANKTAFLEMLEKSALANRA